MQPERSIHVGGGVYLPETENHVADQMLRGKRFRVVDGKPTFQYHKYEAALKYVKRRGVALDVGANVGLWAMWICRDFDKAELFEPNEEAYRLIPANLAGRDNWTLHPVALGAETGRVAIHCDKAPCWGRVKEGDDVDLRPIDSFGFEAVDFIKIDVEGFELDVVKGAEQTIRKLRPVLVVEQKGNESVFGHEKHAASDLLHQWGFESVEVLSGDHIMVHRG